MASATEAEELETMVVNIIGNAEAYLKMLNEAQEKSREAADVIEKHVHKVEGLTESLTRFGHTLIGVFTAVAEYEVLKGFFHSFEGRETTIVKLTAALEANGRQVKQLMEEYRTFSKEIAETTTTGERETLQLLQKAETFGLTGKAAERAAKSAIGLASAHGLGAERALRMAAALEQGVVHPMLARYIPALRNAKDNIEKLAIANAAMAKMFKVAESEANTAHGALHHLGNAVMELKADLGEAVAKAIVPVIHGLTEFVNTIRGLPSSLKEATVYIVGLTGAMYALAVASGVAAKAIRGLMSDLVVIGEILAALVTTATGGAALIAAGGALLGLSYYKAQTQTLNDEIERGIKLNKKWEEGFDRITASIAQSAAAKRGPEKKEFLEAEVGKAKKEMEGYKAGVASAKRELKELDTIWNKVPGNKMIEFAQNQLAEWTKKMEKGEDRVHTLEAALEEFSGKKISDEVTKLTNNLTDQIDTMGLSADRLEAYKIAQTGATAATMESINAVIEQKEIAEDFNKTMDTVDKLTESLDEQNNTWGMSARDAQLYKLSLHDIGDENLEAARSAANLREEEEYWDKSIKEGASLTDSMRTPLEKLADEMDNLDKLLGDQSITWETYQRAVDKAMDTFAAEGNRIKESVMTPYEKFSDQIDKLNELLDTGAISWEVYQRATEKAQKDLQGVNKEVERLSNFDVALAGSAEAITRIQQQADVMRERMLIRGTIAGGEASERIREAPPIGAEPPGGPEAREVLSVNKSQLTVLQSIDRAVNKAQDMVPMAAKF